ncbi:MAG: hypothetical protein HYX28_11310 [Candidatus Koribacter versatilis]|uniref:Uncharacterized protein n=1 Tax=Candidatus Korobacter versatilis TaxID=658062 RepID=A0A932ABT7_9BACT|nr:hypothetical protein [Candidatus Koribacter versatilis]
MNRCASAVASLALLLFVWAGAGDSLAQQAAPSDQRSLADSLERKVEYLRTNAAKTKPDPRPTVLTNEEVDAYMNSGRLKVPNGVSDIHLTTTAGEATASAKVDFDRLLRDVRKSSLLWQLFTGVHEVKARCGVWGKDGLGNVHVQNVWLDGHEVPRVALEFFLERYLKPKVPQAALDSRFRMPVRIWSATVTSGKTTLVQR